MEILMSNTKAGILSLTFVKSYFITMRPYLLFLSGITGLAGIAFVDGPGPAAILIFLAAFLSYGFGQALTDCFQIDTDSISSPYRPLTQGIISRRDVLFVSLAGLIFCLIVFSINNPVNAILCIIGTLGLATYTYFKKRWWGGPFYNSWIVAVLLVISFQSNYFYFVTELPENFFLMIGAVFFLYANFVLTGYYKDIEADRQTGYNTLLVKFGRKLSNIISDVFAALGGLFIIVLLYSENSISGFQNISTLLFLISGMAALIIGQVRLHKVSTDDEAHSAISPVIHSYVLLLSAGILTLKPEWLYILAIYYLIFILVLKLRPAKNQI